MSAIESLPVELFGNIFGDITQVHDLCTLRAVNRFFSSMFTPVAFKTMRFQNTELDASRFTSLASSGVALWVRDLSLDFDGKITPGNVAGGAACGASSQITSGSGASVNSDGGYVGAFIHLQSLSVQLPNRHSSDEYRSKVYDIAFRAFSSSTMAPRSLTITNLLRTGVEDYSKSLGFQRFLGRLTHLSIDISDFDWTTNSPGTLLECWLGPAQASLESLTLTSTSWAPRFPANLKFSKLKKLELANVLFSMENPVQALILSDPIASNLEELTLNACVISLQGSNDKSTWADLFRAFQVTLTRLKKFTIRSTLSYIMIDGYSNQAPERTEAYPADAKAANMLWEGLGQEERMSSVRSYNESTVAYGILDYFDFDSFLLPHGFHMAHPTPFELVFGSQEQLEETIS